MMQHFARPFAALADADRSRSNEGRESPQNPAVVARSRRREKRFTNRETPLDVKLADMRRSSTQMPSPRPIEHGQHCLGAERAPSPEPLLL